MNKKLIKLPIVTLIIGILLRISQFATGYFLALGTTEWTLEMGNTTFYINLLLSIVLFIIGGISLHRTDKTSLAKSATILVIYYVLMLALEKVTQNFGVYMIIYWLFLPVELFTTITSVIVKISPAEEIYWIYVLPSIIAPYMFIIFGENSIKDNN